MNFEAINAELKDKHPVEIIRWAADRADNPIVTTNFGPFEAVILHLVSQVKADMPVVWMDSGYGTPETYQFADKLVNDLGLNLRVYNPKQTAARRDALMGGIPDISDPLHEEFTEQVKLEPFQRAMAEMNPDYWFTAIRRDQTEFRKSLDIVTQDKTGGVIKVAPVFYWSDEDMQAYLDEHGLPNETNYYDPTKVLGQRECGLHTRASA